MGDGVVLLFVGGDVVVLFVGAGAAVVLVGGGVAVDEQLQPSGSPKVSPVHKSMWYCLIEGIGQQGQRTKGTDMTEDT